MRCRDLSVSTIPRHGTPTSAIVQPMVALSLALWIGCAGDPPASKDGHEFTPDTAPPWSPSFAVNVEEVLVHVASCTQTPPP